MLSDTLDSYAEHFANWAASGGVRLDARMCGLLRTSFNDAADQARGLEGQPVPDAQRPLPAGVVRLADFRRAGGIGGTGDGGKAA